VRRARIIYNSADLQSPFLQSLHISTYQAGHVTIWS